MLDDTHQCRVCSFRYDTVLIEARAILDLRGLHAPATVQLDMAIPIEPLPADLRESLLTPRIWRPVLMDREQLRRRYGTKLSEGYEHHLENLIEERGTDLVALDLGCGSGGNGQYLAMLGITTTVGVDWWSSGADFLADAHRLPFPDASFDLVVATAVLEHCYLPHLVMREVERVLTPGGVALMGASFWESWHGESFFHFTPNGLYAVCSQAGLRLTDLWSGWGFIPAVLSHAVAARFKKPGYRLQRVWDAAATWRYGRNDAYLRKIKTSGALHFRADKPA